MVSIGSTKRHRSAKRLFRFGRHVLNRLARRFGLSARFLLVSVVVVTLAMLSLGTWIGSLVRTNITEGVATTAAASIGALIGNELVAYTPGAQLPQATRQRLDHILEIGNNPNGNRLLEVRITTLDGRTIYESKGTFIASAGLPKATPGDGRPALKADIVSLDVPPAAPVPSRPITVLRILAPIYAPGTDRTLALGELYFSARAVLTRERAAQQQVWLLTGLAGVALIGALYVFVDRASRTIFDQRRKLAENLAVSRRLNDENRALHAASEQLRINANLANENLLVHVGSDIHDGPIQNLTLMILNLTGLQGHPSVSSSPEAAPLADAVALATESVDDLRNISAGLVLPELADLDLAETIDLAISRHEALSGSHIDRRLRLAAANASTEVKVCAYRVVQEGLTNAQRHAPGARYRVGASTRSGVLTLDISNEGGVEQPAVGAGATPKMGLRGMRFRVESLGGDLKVSIGRRKTQVRARIPLAPGQ